MTLLQTVPDNVSLSKIEKELARVTYNNSPVDIDSLHVWALSDNELYGTVNVKISKNGAADDLENVRNCIFNINLKNNSDSE